MSKSVIVLLFATKPEAQPYIQSLQVPLIQQQPFFLYGGDSSLYILIGGIGITKAAIAATYACTTLNADTVINIGAAGALTQNLVLGTIITVHTVYDMSRYNFNTEEPFCYALTPLSDFPQCTCVSVLQPLRTSQERKAFTPLADIVDMELAGITCAVQKFKKKCYSIKYISDTDSHTTHESIIENIKELSVSTSPQIIKCIHSLMQ